MTLFLVIAFLPQFPQAQSSSALPLKVATVNINAIRGKSTAGKSFNALALAFQESINIELQKEGEGLRVTSEELARKRALLAPEVFDAERIKHQKRIATFQKKRQTTQKLMNKKLLAAKSQLNQKIVEIIKRFSKKEKITLILPDSNVVMSANSYNISNRVLAVLNKELPELSIKMPTK